MTCNSNFRIVYTIQVYDTLTLGITLSGRRRFAAMDLNRVFCDVLLLGKKAHYMETSTSFSSVFIYPFIDEL